MSRLIDSYKHKGLRKLLVEQLRDNRLSRSPITDEAVLKAIGKVPRHLFLDKTFDEFAYQDKAFQIGCKQTISQPYTVAFQSQLLEIKPREKVLEIGTGSGYQACILMEMGAKVFTVERQRVLFDKARLLLSEMGYNPQMRYGDGYEGWPTYAPFHKIIVTCGATEIPEKLIKQLKPGGMMVVPVGEQNGIQEMLRITNIPGSRPEHFGSFRFVPMLEDKETSSQ